VTVQPSFYRGNCIFLCARHCCQCCHSVVTEKHYSSWWKNTRL